MTEATEAIVLVGGRGTRLRPLTVGTPKPMLPTANVPFLAHLLCRARDAGIDHVVLATSYRPQVFAEHFGDGRHLGLTLDYVVETEPQGTAGAIRNVSERLASAADDPVVVLNGDILSGHDIAAQVAAHVAADADVTLHLTEVDDARAFGCVPTDDAGRVTAFLEKSPAPVTNRVNAGCYVFRRRLIDAIPADRPVSVERETFPGLLSEGAVVLGHFEPAYWSDVGTPAAFVQGSCDLVRGRLASGALPGAPGEALLAPDAEVAADAVVRGGTAVGAGARVESGATVDGCVLFDGAIVEAGAVVRASAIGAGASVGESSVLDGVMVGDCAYVGAYNELVAGVRIWPDAIIPDRAIRFSSDESPR